MTPKLGQWSTYREMMSQPQVWSSWADRLENTARDLRAWIAERGRQEIWFCGAGSSSYVGATLTPYLNASSGTRFRAVPTTDLVSCPSNYFGHDTQPLVISIGRSGQSSESIGTLDLLDRLAPCADRLNVTCNEKSVLATRQPAGSGKQREIILPAACHDAGFAMTVSFTTLLLTVLACVDPRPPADIGERVRALADAAKAILAIDLAQIGLDSPPRRAVFLGSAALCGAAREGALKVLELTAGQVATFAGSPLAFRHGPKAFIDEQTKVFVFISNHPTTQSYDLDLAAEIADQFGADKVVTVGAPEHRPTVSVPAIGNDAWASVLYVLLAQRLSVHWSGAMGLNVDNPFLSHGHLTRVVSDVALYIPEPV